MRTLALALLLCCASSALAQGIVPDPPEQGRRPMEPVWLVEHRFAVSIRNQVASTEVTQVFENRGRAPAEGTYLFPLPEGAALSDFKMTMGEKMVPGEILDAAKAREIYWSIVQQRRDPGLLEFAGQSCFRARVFPIPPRGRTTVKITYSQILSPETDALEYRYPLRSSRFAPGPLLVAGSIEATEEGGIATLFSPTHALDVVRRGDGSVLASFEETRSLGDRDFEMLYSLGRKDFGLSLATHNPPGEEGYFLMILAPGAVAEEKPLPKDVVFVLDTSGSMGERGGAKLKQAKAAVEYALSRLSPGDRFNLVSFATEARPFRPTVVEATAENVAAAREHLAGLVPTGGTAIQQALVTALRIGKEPGRVPLLLFLTDGQPTIGPVRTPEILAAAEGANVAGARLFVFGVGDDVNATLLTELAARTRGTGHFVAESEDIERKVSSLYDRIRSPVLTDLRVTIDGLEVHDVYPRELGDLFAGQQLAVTGRYRGTGPRAVRLQGRIGDRVVEHVYEATFGAGAGPQPLPRLWATRKVGFLLEEIRRNGERAELVNEVRTLGIRHGIVTPYTSFLILEEQELRRMRLPPADRADGGERPGGAGAMPFEEMDEERKSADNARDALGEGREAGAGAVAGAKMAEHLRAGKDRAQRGVRIIEGRTFRLRDGVWTDLETEKPFSGPARTIVYLSEEYRLLLDDERLARLLSVGERVSLIHEGTWYTIVVEE